MISFPTLPHTPSRLRRLLMPWLRDHPAASSAGTNASSFDLLSSGLATRPATVSLRALEAPTTDRWEGEAARVERFAEKVAAFLWAGMNGARGTRR